jgi:hypothetical protein
LQARFKDKKLISLDYVTQMERASKLDIFQILALTGFALLSVALATILVTLHVASLRWRITLLITVVGAVIIGIQFAYSLGGVAHINVKFYYLFGILIAMVVSIGDYLHHVRVVDHPDGDSKFTAIALQERHKKWTSALGYSLTLLTVMLGTISFNVIPYIRLVFGDSFLIAPTLGIAVACAFLILIFSMGIIGNIRKILIEIESEIARLRDTAATQA